MSDFNLGALLLALLLLLWLAYAIPRIAQRREHLGRSHEQSGERFSDTARDLTAGIRAQRQPVKASPMARNSALLRPASPIERPRFQLESGESDLGASIIGDQPRSQRSLAILLLSCIGLTALLTLAAVAALVPWWAAAAALVLTAGVVVGLRLTRDSRRRVLSTEHAEPQMPPLEADAADTRRTPAQSSDAAAPERAADARSSSVMGAQERYDAFLRDVIGAPAKPVRESFRYGALSSASAPLEYTHLEELEALEDAGVDTRGTAGRPIAEGLTLDQILERRRA